MSLFCAVMVSSVAVMYTMTALTGRNSVTGNWEKEIDITCLLGF